MGVLIPSPAPLLFLQLWRSLLPQMWYVLQMWDLQMQNAFLRHQLALAEQKKDWLAHQLQELQAKYAALTEQKAGQQELDAPRESSSWVSFPNSSHCLLLVHVAQQPCPLQVRPANALFYLLLHLPLAGTFWPAECLLMCSLTSIQQLWCICNCSCNKSACFLCSVAVSFAEHVGQHCNMLVARGDSGCLLTPACSDPFCMMCKQSGMPRHAR